jgi:hypothetical protein
VRILRSFGSRNEHIELDPIPATEYDQGLTRRCEAAVGLSLYTLDYQEQQNREAVFFDEAGRVYINFGDTLYLLADTSEHALDYLVRIG